MLSLGSRTSALRNTSMSGRRESVSGVTVTDAIAATTATTAEPRPLPDVAEIWATPGIRALTRPVVDSVATAVSELDQLASVMLMGAPAGCGRAPPHPPV